MKDSKPIAIISTLGGYTRVYDRILTAIADEEVFDEVNIKILDLEIYNFIKDKVLHKSFKVKFNFEEGFEITYDLYDVHEY